VWDSEEPELETVVVKVFVVPKVEDRRLTIVAFVPRLIPFRTQLTVHEPSEGATTKAFNDVAEFGIMTFVLLGLLDEILQEGRTWTDQLQVEVS